MGYVSCWIRQHIRTMHFKQKESHTQKAKWKRGCDNERNK